MCCLLKLAVKIRGQLIRHKVKAKHNNDNNTGVLVFKCVYKIRIGLMICRANRHFRNTLIFFLPKYNRYLFIWKKSNRITRITHQEDHWEHLIDFNGFCLYTRWMNQFSSELHSYRLPLFNKQVGLIKYSTCPYQTFSGVARIFTDLLQSSTICQSILQFPAFRKYFFLFIKSVLGAILKIKARNGTMNLTLKVKISLKFRRTN